MEYPKTSAHRRFLEPNCHLSEGHAVQKTIANAGFTSPLGKAVRARRQNRRLSLDKLALLAGCSKSYLSAIENNRCGPPGTEILRRLEAVLEAHDGEFIRLAA